jgi:hypothetical protein
MHEYCMNGAFLGVSRCPTDPNEELRQLPRCRSTLFAAADQAGAKVQSEAGAGEHIIPALSLVPRVDNGQAQDAQI